MILAGTRWQLLSMGPGVAAAEVPEEVRLPRAW